MRLRQSLVAVQLALAVVALVASGLLVRSFVGVLATDLGFTPFGVLSFRLEPPWRPLPQNQADDVVLAHIAADRARAWTFYDTLLGRLRAVAGVEQVAVINAQPLSGRLWSTTVRIDGRGEGLDQGRATTLSRVVSPGYFGTLQIPLLAGRDFDDSDHFNSPSVAVVNRESATRYLNPAGAIGQRVSLRGDRWFTVVGVVSDVPDDGVDQPRQPTLFMTLALGASRTNVLRLVMMQGLAVTLGRVGAGLAVAWLLSRLIASILFDVAPTDPLTCLSVAVALVGAAVACYLPARRAAKVNPAEALKVQ